MAPEPAAVVVGSASPGGGAGAGVAGLIVSETRLRSGRAALLGSRKAPSAWVAVPLLRGQEVIARFAGAWRPAVVMRPPRGRGAVGVVDTETWTERQVPLADIAVKATLAAALRTSSKAAAQNAKAAAARVARVEQRVTKARAAANASPVRTATAVQSALPLGFGTLARGPSSAASTTDGGASLPTSPASTSTSGAIVSPLAAMSPSEPSVILKRNRCRPEKAGLDTRALKKVDEVLHAKVDNNEMPGVISIVYRHGVLAHLDCYGYADMERKTPMRPDSIIRLYSMTKCIISVAVAVCLEDKLLDLQDPVSKFIPAFADVKVRQEGGELQPAVRPITVVHLLTHTAGMGYGPMLGDEPDGETEERFVPLIERSGLGRTAPSNPKAITTLEQWCNEVAKVPLRSQPGAEWFYSYSHDVVGRVVEVVTGQRLDAFLQKRILGPLGMVDTGFEVPREKWDRVAGMYRRIEVEKHDEKPEAAATSTAKVAVARDAPAVIADGGAAAGDMVPAAEGDGRTEAVHAASDRMEVDDPAAPRTSDSGASPTPPTPSEDAAQTDGTTYELRRLDGRSLETNEWMAGNASPILSGGGSVDAMTGGLVSTAADYSRFCLMLLRKGELDGVRILRPETVDLLCTNQLPAATGSDDVWAFSTPGVGFGLIGSVSVSHPELDAALKPGEYGWGGMAGTAWTNDPHEDFFLLSFSLTAFDLTTEEELRGGVRASIAQFDQRREKAEMRRMEKLEKEQRRLDRSETATAFDAAAVGVARTTTPTKRMRSPPSAAKSAGARDGSKKKRRTTIGAEAAGTARKSPQKASPTKTPRRARSLTTGPGSARKAVGNLQQGAAELDTPRQSVTGRGIVVEAEERSSLLRDSADADAVTTPERCVRLRFDGDVAMTACAVSA